MKLTVGFSIGLFLVLGCVDTLSVRVQDFRSRSAAFEQAGKSWDKQWNDFRYNLSDEQVRAIKKAEELQNKASWDTFYMGLSSGQQQEFMDLEQWGAQLDEEAAALAEDVVLPRIQATEVSYFGRSKANLWAAL